jgi:hypothetical protein
MVVKPFKYTKLEIFLAGTLMEENIPLFIWEFLWDFRSLTYFTGEGCIWELLSRKDRIPVVNHFDTA